MNYNALSKRDPPPEEEGDEGRNGHVSESPHLDQSQNDPVTERGPEVGCVNDDETGDTDRRGRREYGIDESRALPRRSGVRQHEQAGPRQDQDAVPDSERLGWRQRPLRELRDPSRNTAQDFPCPFSAFMSGLCPCQGFFRCTTLKKRNEDGTLESGEARAGVAIHPLP